MQKQCIPTNNDMVKSTGGSANVFLFLLRQMFGKVFSYFILIKQSVTKDAFAI